MSPIARICRTLVLSIGLVASGIGPGAALDCPYSDNFRLTIRNKSPEPIDDIEIAALEQFGITQLRLSPSSTVELCLSKVPATCLTTVQVAYRDFPPITYERDICKTRTLILKKE